MRTRQGGRTGGDGPRRDHHDWASETYVDEWVKRQQAEDVAALVRHGRRSPATLTREPFPAALDQHLAALKAVGFKAVFGGYA